MRAGAWLGYAEGPVRMRGRGPSCATREARVTPDVRGPWRYLAWLARRHWGPLAAGTAFSTVWAVSQGVAPGLIGEAVNAGLVARDEGALAWWGLSILGLGAVQALSAMMQERCILPASTGSSYDTLRLVTARACELGATVSRRVSDGDLVTIGLWDVSRLSQAMDFLARAAGGATAVIVIGVLMLAASWQAGLLVLLGVPAILLVTARVTGRMRARQAEMRAQQGDLTGLAIDIVRGLRVLRGIGGEDAVAARYRDGSQRLRLARLRVVRAQALVGAASTFLPGLLLVAVVALSAHMVLARQLSAGQMVAFYGYAAFLAVPVQRMTSGVSRVMQAHVSAGHVVALLRTESGVALAPAQAAVPGTLDGPGVLADPESGLAVLPGLLTAVACAPADSIALADRLGRYAGLRRHLQRPAPGGPVARRSAGGDPGDPGGRAPVRRDAATRTRPPGPAGRRRRALVGGP